MIISKKNRAGSDTRIDSINKCFFLKIVPLIIEKVKKIKIPSKTDRSRSDIKLDKL